MLKQYIEKLIEKLDLTLEEAKDALGVLLTCENAHQVAAILVLLRAKGETPQEIAGMVAAMREQATSVHIKEPLLDIVGTGGDNFGTVNISTGASLIAAAAGAKVAKHGNRSVSSKCGSADILERFGIELELQPKSIEKCIETVGIGFMYAPFYHPALQKIASVRKALKIRTIFNIVGPLINPAFAEYQMIGVSDEKLLDTIAQSLYEIGTTKSLIIHSMGLDELTLAAPASVRLVLQDEIREEIIDPLDLGFSRSPIEALKGGDVETNYGLLMRAFSGESFPIADALILNAGVSLELCGLAKDRQEGVDIARVVLEEKRVLELLEKWALCSKKLKSEEK